MSHGFLVLTESWVVGFNSESLVVDFNCESWVGKSVCLTLN